MSSIRITWCALLAWVTLSLSTHAQVPPAEQLLPDDTIGVFTVPDWKKLRQAQGESAWGQLWADPAMKPFRDNFSSNIQNDFIKPLEKELGVSLESYQELLQGQLTLALLPPKADSSDFASFLFILDTRDKADLLTTKLAELKKRWKDNNKEVRIEKIRDVEFNTVSISQADIDAVLQKAFPSADEEESEEEKPADSSEGMVLRIGQFKSLLIISENEKAIEKVLAKQSGGLIPALADLAGYQKSHTLMFRDSLAHGWINIRPIYEKAMQQAAKQPEEGQAEPGMPGMKMDKILPALGLSSLQSLSVKMSSTADGTSFDIFAAVPETQRDGLFKMLTLEKKDSAPPAFVPADAMKFQRSRIDAQKAWATAESILSKIDPSLAGLVQLMLSSAGKDQDPNFDLKKNLIGNLGDDFIQYQKSPKGTTAAELNSAPSLVLVGSPNAPALLDAVRTISSLLPEPLSSGPLKEREFLGRKIYSLSMASAAPPAEEGEDDDQAKPAPAAPPQMVSFTASGGYVVFSTENSVLEEYLRSGESPPKSLRAVPGLTDAAQKTGGMESGYFSYDNQAESLRITLQALKNDPEGFNKMLFFAFSQGDEDGQETFNRFLNLKLLPDFDRISRYLGFLITSGTSTPDGFLFKSYGPRPAGLAK